MGSAVTPDLSKGGEVDGNLTITGDFKVEGAGSFAYDEIIEGTIGATRVNIGTRDASGNPPTDNASYMLQIEKYGGTANIKLTRTGNASSEWSNIHNEATIGTITEHPFVLQTHSTDRLTITSAGLIGINTSSPSYALDVVGVGRFKASQTTDQLVLTDSTNSTNSSFRSVSGTLFIKPDGSNIKATLNSAGRLGIGTSSPSHLLSLTASNTVSLIKFLNSSATSNGGEIGLNGIDAYLWNRESLGKIYFGTNNTTRMMITYDGKIGINTSSPVSTLHVEGVSTTTSGDANAGITLKAGGEKILQGWDEGNVNIGEGTFTTAYKIMLHGRTKVQNSDIIVDQNKKYAWGNETVYLAGSEANGIDFYHSSTHLGRFKTTGFGIGTASPDSDYRLTVQQPTGTNKDYILGIQDNGSNTAFKIDTDSGDNVALKLYNGSGAEKIRFDAGGVSYVNNGQNFGIGTASPSHPLHINSGVSNGQLMQLHNTNNADGTFIKFTGAHSTSEDWQIGSGTLGYYIYNLTDSSMGLMVSNAGKIGIGTTSPNTNLEVVGTIRASGATPIIQLKETDTSNAIQGFQINSSGGSISFNSLNNNDGFTSTDYQMHRTGSGAYYHKWFIANSSKMILNNSGNLGIGTDSPSQKLDIYGSMVIDAWIRGWEVPSNHTYGRYWMNFNSGHPLYRTGADDKYHKFQRYSDEDVMVVGGSNKRVGIGTSSPATQLHLNSTSPDIRIQVSSGTNFGSLQFYNNSGALASAIGNYGHTQNLYFQVQGANNALFHSAGNIFYKDIEIENQFPNITFDDSQGGVMKIGSNSGDIRIFQNASGDSATTETIYVTNTGKVGIGNSSSNQPTAKLEVTPNDSDLTSNSALGLWIKGSNGGIKIGRHDGNDGAFTHIYTDVASTDFAYIVTNDRTGGGIATDRVAGADNNPSNNYIELKSYAQTHSILGTTKFKLDQNSRISLSNNDSGTSNTVFGKLAGNNIDSGSNYNTFIGEQVSDATMDDANSNVGVGYASLSALTQGDHNVAIGANVMNELTTGSQNVGMGLSALRYNQTGTGNIALGHQSMQSASGNSHSNNTSVGQQSLYSITTGGNNTALGYQSAYSLTTGSENVSIGRGSSYSATVSGENISIGTQSLYTNTAGKRNIAIGLYSQNAGNLTVEGQIANNVSIGYASSYHNVTGTANTAVGNEAMKGASGNSHSNNTAVGAYSLNAITTGGDNVALGANSLDALTIGTRNTALGYNSATALGAEETGNIAIGWNSMSTMDEGSGGTINYNIALGVQALSGADLGSGTEDISHNIAIGTDSLRLTSGDASTGQIAIGRQALSALTSGSRTTAVGYQAGLTATTIDYTTIVGYQAGLKLLDSTHNTLVGYTAGYSLGSDEADSNTFMGTSAGANGDYSTTNNNTANNNVGIGKSSMGGSQGSGSSYNFTATNNVAIGVDSLKVITTANNSTAVGYGALQSLTAGNSNLAIGYESSKTLSGGAANITLGHQAMLNATNISSAIFIGANAGDAITTSTDPNGTIGIGYNSLTALTSGAGNTAIGYEASDSVTTGAGNTSLGYRALASSASSSDNNVAIGYQAMDASHGTGGGQNVFMGKNAGGGTWTTGACNFNVGIGSEALAGALAVSSGTIGIGYQALTALTSGNQNTVIGYQAAMELQDNHANTVIGYQAMYRSGATTYHNTFVGNLAGDGDWTGACHSNTAVGSSVMRGAMTITAVDNVAMGRDTLAALTSGASNTALGADAGDVITTGLNNTIVGKGSDPSANNATNQTVVGYAVTGIADNTAVIGNSAVTKVYMASDANDSATSQAEGAELIAKSGYFKTIGIDGSLTGGSATSDNPILTLHGAYNQSPNGSNGHSLKFVMHDNTTTSTHTGETARIATVSRSGSMASGISTFGTDLEFHNRVGGTMTKQMTIRGGDNRNKVIIHGNNAGGSGGVALEVHNDGNDANRDGIEITAGADDASGTTAYIDAHDGNGDQVGHISNTSGTFALTDVSDKRLKKNIVDTSVKGVETIDKMKVRDFEWIKSGDKMTAGFIAQELAEAFPSAVTGEDGAMEDILDDDGNKTGERIKPMGVSRDVLVPVLIKAVQELSTRIKELEGK